MKKLAITLLGLSSILGTSAMAAEQAPAQQQPAAKQAAASYQCAQDKSVVVNYVINDAGAPALAAFEHEGAVKQLQINPSQSDQNALTFTSEDGYNLNASIDASNDIFAETIDITGPNSEAVFQNCQATTNS